MFRLFSTNTGKSTFRQLRPPCFISVIQKGLFRSSSKKTQQDQAVYGKSGSVGIMLVTVFLVCFLLMPAASFLITKLHTASLVLHASQKTEQALSGTFVLADEQDLGEARMQMSSYQLSQYVHTQIMNNLPVYIQEKAHISEIRLDAVTSSDSSMHWTDPDSHGLHWRKVSCELRVEALDGNHHTIQRSVLLLLD